MSNSMFQAYTDYVTTVNKMALDSTMTLVKTTQEFVAEAHKLNPYKDIFGIMDTMVAKTTNKNK